MTFRVLFLGVGLSAFSSVSHQISKGFEAAKYSQATQGPWDYLYIQATKLHCLSVVLFDNRLCIRDGTLM